MRTKQLLGLSTLALLALACTNDEVITSPADDQLTITATYEQDGTRATVDNSNGAFSWANGDAIDLYTQKGKFLTLTASSINGNEASFSGIIVGDKLNSNGVGVFPAGIAQSLGGNKLTVKLPSVYTYAEGVLNAPMLAVSTDGNKTYPFKHLGGVLWIQLNNVPAGANKLVFKATKRITGDFNVDDVTADKPTIKLAESDDVAQSDNTVEIDFTASSTAIETQNFYIPLPVGAYSGFSIELQNANGLITAYNGAYEFKYTATKEYTLNRTDLAKFILTFVDITATGESYTTYTESDEETSQAAKSVPAGATATIEADYSMGSVEVGTAVGSNTTIVAAQGSGSDGFTLTQSGGNTSSASENEINLVNEGNAAKLTATVGKSTLGVEGSFSDMDVISGTSTLIIKSTATVTGTVTTRGGNIKVEKGATITGASFVNATSGTLYIIDETGTINSNNDNLKVVASEEEIAKLELQALIDSASAGGTVTLDKDYTVSGNISIAKNLTLDLNGHTILEGSTFSDSQVIYITSGEVTIKDGSAAGTGTIKAIGTNDPYVTNTTGKNVVAVQVTSSNKSAKLTLESGNIIFRFAGISLDGSYLNISGPAKIAGGLRGVRIKDDVRVISSEILVSGDPVITTEGVDGKLSAYGFGLFARGNAEDRAKLTITGNPTVVTSEEGFAISGNGSYQETEINISNGTYKSVGYGLYQPQNGKLTISGGTFEGAKGGIEIRSGEVVIKDNAKISTTATKYSCQANGSGTTTIGAAVSVAQHNTKNDISVTIEGGELSGIYALAENNPQPNDAEAIAKVKLAVSGGTFSGAVYSEDKTSFVSGGSFTKQLDSKYIADDKTLTYSNGYYVVK